jgi:hypothetical protein
MCHGIKKKRALAEITGALGYVVMRQKIACFRDRKRALEICDVLGKKAKKRPLSGAAVRQREAKKPVPDWFSTLMLVDQD